MQIHVNMAEAATTHPVHLPVAALMATLAPAVNQTSMNVSASLAGMEPPALTCWASSNASAHQVSWGCCVKWKGVLRRAASMEEPASLRATESLASVHLVLKDLDVSWWWTDVPVPPAKMGDSARILQGSSIASAPKVSKDASVRETQTHASVHPVDMELV